MYIEDMDTRILRSHSRLILGLLLLLPAASGLAALDWEGECVRVADGDTVTVMYHELPLKVRLYGIDAPERGQDFGRRSRQHLAELVHRKTVRVEFMGFDAYNRALGILHVDGTEVNAEMVSAGMAWVYTQYCREPHLAAWQRLEETARESGTGLWSQPNASAPWEYRKDRKNSRAASSAAPESVPPEESPAAGQPAA